MKITWNRDKSACAGGGGGGGDDFQLECVMFLLSV